MAEIFELSLEQGLIIRPGDRVLVATPRDLTQADANFLRMKLAERFPEAEFTVVQAVALAKMER